MIQVIKHKDVSKAPKEIQSFIKNLQKIGLDQPSYWLTTAASQDRADVVEFILDEFGTDQRSIDDVNKIANINKAKAVLKVMKGVNL